MLTAITNAIITIRSKVDREDGQALAEYGLIVGLIAVVSVIALTAVGLGVLEELNALGSAIGGGA